VVAFVALWALGAILKRPMMANWYIEPGASGFVVHMFATSHVSFADVAAAWQEGDRLWIRFKRPLPFTVLPPIRVGRRQIGFTVDDAESLVEVLNSHIDHEPASSVRPPP
jgi:hypothetical protein